MNQKQLTNAIEEGILKGFWKPIIIAISVWTVVLIIMAGIFVYENNRQCGKNGCQVTAVASQPDNCNYPYVECKIYQEHSYFDCSNLKTNIGVVAVQFYVDDNKTTTNNSVNGIGVNGHGCADVSSQVPLLTKRLCGYSESESWFNQYKANYDGLFKLKMECK